MTFLIGVGIFLGIPIIVALVIISLVMIGEQLKHKETGTSTSGSDKLVCSLDTDCPTGYVCMYGKCIPRSKWNSSMSSAS